MDVIDVCFRNKDFPQNFLFLILNQISCEAITISGRLKYHQRLICLADIHKVCPYGCNGPFGVVGMPRSRKDLLYACPLSTKRCFAGKVETPILGVSPIMKRK